MKDKYDQVNLLCEQAIARVEKAVLNHKNREPEDLSLAMLENIRVELIKMKMAMSPSRFQPTYGRFIIDWPDEHGLVKKLSELNYQYGRLK